MTDKEIVIALQKCNNGKGHRCSECPALGKYNHRICKATIDKLAVNLIERLQSENTRLKAERDKAVEDMAFNAGDGGCWKTCATHYCSTCNNGDNFSWRGLEE